MTTPNEVPLIEYTGNGTVTTYAWSWKMINESRINVRVDNVVNTAWTLQGNNVVFDVAPADGAVIEIFRRTTVWQPENYRAFGRFPGEKTELSVDRATMITQEVYGKGGSEGEGGIVGGANISILRGEFDCTVVSERGTDAVIPMWTPNDDIPPVIPPDPHITWSGDIIASGFFSTDIPVCNVYFNPDGTCSYNDYNSLSSVEWLDIPVVDDAYWIRVTEFGVPQPKLVIYDPDFTRQLGEAFPIHGTGPHIYIHCVGDTPPVTRYAYITVEICADDGGVPDGAWVSRNIIMEAIFNNA